MLRFIGPIFFLDDSENKEIYSELVLLVNWFTHIFHLMY
jgi:hypothetical protein